MDRRRFVLGLGALGVTSLLAPVLGRPAKTSATPFYLITPNSPVIGVKPRISRNKFIQVLAGTPAASAAGDAYDALVHLRVDPLYFLATFHHESTFGTRGICFEYQTKNPGNTRTVRTPGMSYTTVTTERGDFVKYESWVDGFEDMAFRIIDPFFVYAEEGRTTPATIIPRWAPPSDGNDPLSYISAVVNDMNAWADLLPSLGGGFNAFYQHFAEKLTPQEMTVLFGDLLTNEVNDAGMTVQYFERVRLEWHPGAYPEFFDVLLTRYAAQDAASKGLT